jgi:hypothetical protein
MTSVLVLTPCDDGEARTVGRWGEDAASAMGCVAKVIRTRDEATRELRNSRHLLYFGHGERDALVCRQGRLRRRTQRLCDKDNLGQGVQVVIAVACWSARQLGKDVTTSPFRVSAYVGWLSDMSVHGNMDDPLREAVCDGIRVLAAGGTIEDCASEMSDGFQRAHDVYSRDTGNHLVRMQASHWAQQLSIHGDVNTRLA